MTVQKLLDTDIKDDYVSESFLKKHFKECTTDVGSKYYELRVGDDITLVSCTNGEAKHNGGYYVNVLHNKPMMKLENKKSIQEIVSAFTK